MTTKLSISKRKIKARGTVQTTPLGSAQTEEFITQVEYEKQDTTAFLIPLEDIPLKIDSFHRVYDVLWALPGYSLSDDMGSLASNAVLSNLGGTTVVLYNRSPETITLRMQQPYGYKTSPSSLAMWVPVKGRELVFDIKPQEKVHINIKQGTFSHMVPRQTVIDACTCADLFFLSAQRQPYSDSGNNITTPSPSEVGMEVCVTVTYTSSDNSVGTQRQRFTTLVYNDEVIMNLVNSPPPQSVRVSELRGVEPDYAAPYIDTLYMNVNSDSAYFMVAFLGRVPGLVYQAISTRVQGLDESTVYMLPTSIIGSNNSIPDISVIYFDDMSIPKVNRWRLGRMYPEIAANKQKYFITKWCISATTGSTGDYTGLPSNCTLVPVAYKPAMNYKSSQKGGSALSVLPFQRLSSAHIKGKVGIRACVQAKTHQSAYSEHLFDEPFAEHLLKTVTTVVKILRVGVEIAGMVGLLAVPVPAPEPQRVSSTPRVTDEYELVAKATGS